MEISKQKAIIPVINKIFDTSAEVGVDCDFTLPDYYPEISRILKILTNVNISSAHCGNNVISVGGQTVLTLLYISADGNMNSFTHYVPFAKNIESSADISGLVTAKPYVNYLNSKAVAPRKVEAHGSLALNVSVSSVTEHSVLSECDCEGVYVKNAECNIAVPLEPVAKSVFVDDEITVGEGKPTIGKILRNDAKAVITECKYVSGKAVIKGNLNVELLCCPPDNGRPMLLKEQRGFSQIIDCDMIGETINFEVFPRMENFELRPKTSLDGEVRTVAFEAKIGLDIFAFCKDNRKYIADTFTTKYSAAVKRETIDCEDHITRISEKFLCEKTLDFTGVLDSVYDLWCDVSVDYCSADGEDLLIKGNVPLCLLGYNSDGEALYYEKSVDFEYRCNVGYAENGIRCRPSVTVSAVNYSISPDGSLKVVVELSIDANVFKIIRCSAVTTIDVDTENTVKKADNAAVTLYFAENESPWEIAQKYCVSPQSICVANKIDSFDDKCNGVLLIPAV